MEIEVSHSSAKCSHWTNSVFSIPCSTFVIDEKCGAYTQQIYWETNGGFECCKNDLSAFLHPSKTDDVQQGVVELLSSLLLR